MTRDNRPDDETSYAHIYLGDFIADTMHFTAAEHRALRFLLLQLWARGRVARSQLIAVAQVAAVDWALASPTVLAVLRKARPHIKEVRRFLTESIGDRLPSELWNAVREIVFERDGFACVYCGSAQCLEGDHIIPLRRGGSNAIANIATACRACNLSKGSKSLEMWRKTRAILKPEALEKGAFRY